MNHPEYNLQKSICAYLNAQYPNVLYLSTGTSLKLTQSQAGRNKAIQKDGFKCPDLLVLFPNYYYDGLAIELKVKSPFKKDGTLLKNEHLEGQQKAIDELNKLGYYATFGIGFEHCKQIIDEYLSNVLR